MQLTPEDIEKVRTKNIANLLRLANSGKPLTRAQQAELEAFSAGGRQDTAHSTAYAKTQDELASLLGITRKTIGNCLRKCKTATPAVPATRADGRYDVPAWAAFLRAHNIAHKGEDAPKENGPPEATNAPATVVEWKQEKLRLECERLKLELAKTAGELVEVADLEARLGVMLAAFRTAANNLPGRASQKLIGLKDYHIIEEILGTEIAVMLRTLEACPFLEEEPEATEPPGDAPHSPDPPVEPQGIKVKPPQGVHVPRAAKTKGKPKRPRRKPKA